MARCYRKYSLQRSIRGRSDPSEGVPTAAVDGRYLWIFDADHREVGKKEVSDLFAPLLKFVNKKGFKLEMELSQHPILLNFGRRISNHSNRSWKCSRLRVQMSRSIGLIIRTLARPMNLVIFLQTLSRASSTTRSDTANQIGNTA
jgi:hypothetical protein